MNKMTFVKGMGLGLVVGSAVGMVIAPKKKNSPIGKALRSMGDVVEGISETIGL